MFIHKYCQSKFITMIESRLEFYNKYKKTAIKTLENKLGKAGTTLIIQQLVRDPEFNNDVNMFGEQITVIHQQEELLKHLEKCKQMDVNRIKCLEENVKKLNATIEQNSLDFEQYKNTDYENKLTINTLNKKIDDLNSELKSYKKMNDNIFHNIDEISKELKVYEIHDKNNKDGIANLNSVILQLTKELQELKVNNIFDNVPTQDVNMPHGNNNPFINVQNSQEKDPMSGMETILNIVLAKQTSDDAAKDIAYFHGLQSENGDSQAAENFMTFFEDLRKYKTDTMSDDKHMLSLLRRKTKGEARKSLDFYNPLSFIEAIDLFRDRYINENYSLSLKADLRKMNREINEPVKAYHIRVGKLVETIKKITSEPPPFDEIESVLLKPFNDEVVNYHGVRQASKNKDFQALTKELEDSYRRKPSLLKPIKAQNKILVVNDNESQIKCSYCKRTNHLAKDCFHLKAKNDRNQPTQPLGMQQINNEIIDTTVLPPNFYFQQPFRG